MLIFQERRVSKSRLNSHKRYINISGGKVSKSTQISFLILKINSMFLKFGVQFKYFDSGNSFNHKNTLIFQKRRISTQDPRRVFIQRSLFILKIGRIHFKNLVIRFNCILCEYQPLFVGYIGLAPPPTSAK